MKKQKRNSGVPRHKRLKRDSRLLTAKTWATEYNGRNLVKGYSKHFAVDKLCAIKELTLLGYRFDEEYVQQLKQSIEAQKKLIEKRKKLREEKITINIYDDYECMLCEFEDEAKGYAMGNKEVPF